MSSEVYGWYLPQHQDCVSSKNYDFQTSAIRCWNYSGASPDEFVDFDVEVSTAEAKTDVDILGRRLNVETVSSVSEVVISD